tara:strand:- start:682 stop:909 length:228 start_codon:yes stop_codon:yes gene_type:complete
MSRVEKLDLLNIFEIQRIKSLLLIEPKLLETFNSLIKIANKSLNNDKLEKLIETDSEDELDSIDLLSDESDDNFF